MQKNKGDICSQISLVIVTEKIKDFQGHYKGNGRFTLKY